MNLKIKYMENKNIITMAEYCLEKQVRFEINYTPENYLYNGSEMEKEFKIVLQGGNKGRVTVKVYNIQDIENAINFYQDNKC